MGQVQKVKARPALAVVCGLLVVAVSGGLAALIVPGLWPASDASDTLVFGTTISITGQTAKEGEYTRDGYTFYIDAINARGGIRVGDKKYRLKLQYYDDQSSPELAARLYEKLVSEDRVKFLLGPYGSDHSIVAAAVAEKYRLPIVISHGSAEAIFAPEAHYTFGILTPAKNYLRGIIALVLERDPAVRTVALLGSDETFSRDVLAGTAEYARARNLDVIHSEIYPLNASDVSKLLAQVKAKNPDMVLVAGRLQNSLLIVRQARSANLSPRAFGFTVGPSTPEFRANLRSEADYIFGTTQWTSSLQYKGADLWETPGAYAAAFKKVHPAYDDVPYHTAGSTASLLAFQRAIETAQSLDPAAVREALDNLDIMTFYGRIKFDERGMNIYKPMAVEQLYPDGKRYTVFPFDVSERQALYPMPAWDKR